MDLFRKSAHELHELLVNKEISSMELTQSVFNRIDEVEDKVHADDWSRYTTLPRTLREQGQEGVLHLRLVQ